MSAEKFWKQLLALASEKRFKAGEIAETSGWINKRS